MLELEWDEPKREEVLAERGVDILTAALIFERPVLTRRDDRADYGEERFLSLGLVEDVPYTVVWTPRGERRRIVTAWQGGRKDHATYQNRFPG